MGDATVVTCPGCCMSVPSDEMSLHVGGQENLEREVRFLSERGEALVKNMETLIAQNTKAKLANVLSAKKTVDELSPLPEKLQEELYCARMKMYRKMFLDIMSTLDPARSIESPEFAMYLRAWIMQKQAFISDASWPTEPQHRYWLTEGGGLLQRETDLKPLNKLSRLNFECWGEAGVLLGLLNALGEGRDSLEGWSELSFWDFTGAKNIAHEHVEQVNNIFQGTLQLVSSSDAMDGSTVNANLSRVASAMYQASEHGVWWEAMKGEGMAFSHYLAGTDISFKPEESEKALEAYEVHRTQMQRAWADARKNIEDAIEVSLQKLRALLHSLCKLWRREAKNHIIPVEILQDVHRYLKPLHRLFEERSPASLNSRGKELQDQVFELAQLIGE